MVWNGTALKDMPTGAYFPQLGPTTQSFCCLLAVPSSWGPSPHTPALAEVKVHYESLLLDSKSL